MEYTTDWILKSPIEDIQDYLKNATIIDLIAVIENVKKRTKLDYLSMSRVKDIDATINLEKATLDNIDKRIGFAKTTGAPSSDIASLSKDSADTNSKIDGYNSEREKIIQAFNDKKQAVLTLAFKMIGEASVSKLEDYRNHLISYLKDRIASVETNKENREITTDTLLKERSFTKEDLTVKAITREIKEIESAVLDKALVLNEEVISKIKSLRLKKDSLEHETFTYVCTEKLKTSLRGISNDITKLQMELYKIMHLDTNELRNFILKCYTETKEEIKLANYCRIYRSYFENISKVALPLKKTYRQFLESYATNLNSLENPSLDDKSLLDIEESLRENQEYMKTLESYKNREINKSEAEKYLYTSVRSNGLLDLPFSKDKWLSYFGKYFEPLLNSLDKISLKNNKYITLINISLKSKEVTKEISDYEEDLKYLLNELYRKVLSIYLKVNCFINVSVYDYLDSESLNNHMMAEQDNIDKEMNVVNTNITSLMAKKTQIMKQINTIYTTIDTDIKGTLNSILSGTYKEEVKEEVEEPHHFFSTMDYFEVPEEIEKTLTAEEDDSSESSDDESDGFNGNDIFGKNSGSSLEEERVKSRESKVSPESSEIFNPDDIFGVKEEGTLKTSSDVISFDEDDNGITRADKKAFADLLGPTKQEETPKYLESIKEIPKERESEKRLEPKRGTKVIKVEPVVSKEKEEVKKEELKKEVLPEKSDAAEIKERIEKKDQVKKETIFNPATANEVTAEYNDSNAPIDLNAFLNGSLKEGQTPVSSAPTTTDSHLSSNDNLDLMNFLSQIENNDSKGA